MINRISVFILAISMTTPVWATLPLHPVNPRQISISSVDPLWKVVDAGKRNLIWLNRVNTSRAIRSLNPLQLNSVTHGPSPFYFSESTPTSPLKYNGEVIENEFKLFLAKAPLPFVKRITGKSDLTSDQVLSEKEYLIWTSTLDFLYNMACRWIYKRQDLADLSAESSKDLRGYLYFAEGSGQLLSESNLERSRSLTALGSLCRNSGKSRSDCDMELNESLRGKNVTSFYQKYFLSGEQIWESFFQIKNPRHDIEWNSKNPQEAGLNFSDPQNESLKLWLKQTIETKWQWKDWKINLNFSGAVNAFMPHLKFYPNTLPRVDHVGGSQITLDQNLSLDQTDTDQTLQHEFGHVLGFPDCYLEFFDTAEQMMIYYELDKTDLMCTHSGSFLERHFEDLKSSYFQE